MARTKPKTTTKTPPTTTTLPRLRRHTIGIGGPLLVVLDGPEYAERMRLLPLLRRLVAAGDVPGHDVVLVEPVDRMATQSANDEFADALVDGLGTRDGRRRPRRVGLGCSLGGLALLHAHRRHPDAFAGLFLQSGSFFQNDTDGMESGFEHFGRITGFVDGVLRASAAAHPVPTTLTCGLDEDNFANNARLARALARQGDDVEFHAVCGGHDWPTWRRGVVEWLPAFLRRVWR